MGQARVRVGRRPVVALLVTGDELLAVDEELAPGKIRSSLGSVAMLRLRGLTEDEALRITGITKADYTRWRRHYHGMTDAQIRRVQDLERQVSRLREQLARIARTAAWYCRRKSEDLRDIPARRDPEPTTTSK